MNSGELAARPFEISVLDDELDRIVDRVRRFRWDAWQEPADPGGWLYGPPASYMSELCAY